MNKYFQKKYSFEVKILADDKFIIPEYKIELFNINKKIEVIPNFIDIDRIKYNVLKTTNVQKYINKQKARTIVKKTLERYRGKNK